MIIEILRLVLWALVALFVLVTVHEFGHYWVARRCGVRVLRFSIGFGKPFLKRHWGETEFAFAPIPLGGYVKMYGETDQEEEPIPEDQKQFSFSHKNVYQRMAVVVAGPAANFLLAVFLYAIVFGGGLTGIAPVIGNVERDSPTGLAGLESSWEIIAVDGRQVATWSQVYDQLAKRIGETGQIEMSLTAPDSNLQRDFSIAIHRWQSDVAQPDILGSLGISPLRPEVLAVVGEVVPDSAADRAGMRTGDRVVQADNVLMQNWDEWRQYVRERPEQLVQLQVEREGRTIYLALIPERIFEEQEQYGRAGIAPQLPDWPEDMIREIDYGFFGSIQEAGAKTWDTTVLILSSLKKMITGQLSTKSIGGPITIAQVAGASADAGWQAFVTFLATLSVMLGVVNLLPIPLLDGGHLLFYIVEAVKGTPLNQPIQGAAVRFGMLFLFGIMLLAVYNDFARL